MPKATKGLPDCPRHLRGRARYAWALWSQELEVMGLDRRPDAMMLEGACIAYETMARAHEKLSKEGEIINSPVLDKDTGEVIGMIQKRNLWNSIRERSQLILKAFCSEFGLSPVSRERLTIEKKDLGEQDLATLLTAPRVPKVTTVIVPSTVN